MGRIWSVAPLLLLCACSSALSPGQRADIVRWNAEAGQAGRPEIHYENYLDPDQAWGLGFVPFGVAGFYVNRPGLAVSGFTWPLSMIWVPAMAYSTAERRNYEEFRQRILTLRQELSPPAVVAPTALHRIPVDPAEAAKQIERLERQWSAGRISETEYLEQRQKITESLTDEQWKQDRPHPIPREK